MPLDKQELFDTMRNHLLKQQDVSILCNDDDTCAYLSQNGLKCAVGCLIKPEFYDKELEGNGVVEYSVLDAVALSLGEREHKDIPKDIVDMMVHMQEFHDFKMKHIMRREGTLENRHFNELRDRCNVK